MKLCAKAATALAALLLTSASVYAKPNIPDLAQKCNSLGKKNACAELAKIALTDKDSRVRSAAASNLTEQSVLEKIATTDEDHSVRNTAVEKLTDQSVLAKIAMTDRSADVRSTAATKLTDGSTLMKIALTDSIPYVRSAAVVKLTDQSALAKIALTDEHPGVRKTAVGKLTDQSVLAKVASDDNDEDVRKLAKARVTDQSYLAEIALADRKRNDLQEAADAVVMKYLSAAKYKSTDWKYFDDLTKIDIQIVDTREGKADILVLVMFRGGTGSGVRLGSGSQLYFGNTIGSTPQSGTHLNGTTLFHSLGYTCMGMPQEFHLVEENGSWRISSMDPIDPADTGILPL